MYHLSEANVGINEIPLPGRGISLLEYSSPVWVGSLTQTQSNRLEAVQRIAADTSLEPLPEEAITLREARLVMSRLIALKQTN